MYMLDSNAFSALMKNNAIVVKHLRQHKSQDIFLPAIVWAEVRYGIYKKNSAKLLESAMRTLQKIRIVPFNRQTADIYAQLRSDMERQGKSLSPMDMLIAATAVANNCVLVTNDQAFLQIEQLQVEDWTV
ncbi:MAG: PIN domain-containing protein [Neisseriaceae bacterium]|nr:PIN domain-containing protein [Neisseriaceae bacterium]MBQ9725335.1 PIN domain-containing protein [Neisseriaceae bacterium]